MEFVKFFNFMKHKTRLGRIVLKIPSARVRVEPVKKRERRKALINTVCFVLKSLPNIQKRYNGAVTNVTTSNPL